MSGELTGKVAIVTGGASGIGKGCVARFVDAGAKVVIADVSEEDGEKFAAELGSDAAFKRTDVSDAGSVNDVVAFAVERFGGLDCMFNNAGISGNRNNHLLDEDFSDFQKVMAVNVLGVAFGTQAAARHMKEHGGGSIINTTSIGGMQPSRGPWSYAMSKASVIMLAQSAALDLGEFGIRVNCIAPETILTERNQQRIPDAQQTLLVDLHPIKRLGTPDDIADAALFLASESSAWVTGVVLDVAGGAVRV
jgi:NAD(P)-dependent dehydrogenase (short-subunit alcohol dehydrogenase family)